MTWINLRETINNVDLYEPVSSICCGSPRVREMYASLTYEEKSNNRSLKTYPKWRFIDKWGFVQ